MIPDMKASVGAMQKVWFVDLVTTGGTASRYHAVPREIPVHLALEQCVGPLNAKYIAVVDQTCPLLRGTERWLRIFHNIRNTSFHEIAQLAKRKQYAIAFAESKAKLNLFFELWIRTRLLLKDINKQEICIIIYLDYASSVQMLAVWLSVVSLVATRNKTIVWTHLDRITGWQGTKIGRFVRRLFTISRIKLWITAYTSEIAEENRRHGCVVDILPLPLKPALNAVACHQKLPNEITVKKSDKLVCWLFIKRAEQGLKLLQGIIDHPSARTFPNKFIKCFVSERVSIKENAEIELVRLPYISEEDYLLHFNECEVVLLPYDADLFSGLPSMVFIEAVATCKIPIVSYGTVMAKELQRFELGDLIMDFNTEFSWTLINEIREDINIRERLNLMAESYVKEHGTFGCAQALYKCLKQIDAKIALSEPKPTQ